MILNLGRNLNIANARYVIPPSSPGPRTFEAARVGALQLYMGQSDCISDYYSEKEGVFKINNIMQIEKLLEEVINDPKSFAGVRRNAILKTLKFHTYANRAQKILNQVYK